VSEVRLQSRQPQLVATWTPVRLCMPQVTPQMHTVLLSWVALASEMFQKKPLKRTASTRDTEV
jgi:hypothetical protein